MKSRLTLRVARRLLSDAPWAAERLRPFAGQQVHWDVAGLRGQVRIDAEGLPEACPEPDAAATAGRLHGVRIHLASADLGALADGMDGLMRRVQLEGNAGLAAELGYIARHLRPDPAEWLSPWIGDILAERADRGARAGLRWSQDAVQRLGRSGGDYLVHELRVLVAPVQVTQWCDDVDRVREAADRLQQRLQRLERSLSARTGRPDAA